MGEVFRPALGPLVQLPELSQGARPFLDTPGKWHQLTRSK